jgi:hypothetical protein
MSYDNYDYLKKNQSIGYYRKPGSDNTFDIFLRKNADSTNTSSVAPMEHNSANVLKIWKFFTKVSYPYRKSNFNRLPMELRGNVQRFLISLDAYLESSNPVLDCNELLFGNLSKEYPSYLKKVRQKAFLDTIRAVSLEEPEWWKEIPLYRINDIGDIFNYQYCLHWIEDVDDYKISSLPVEDLTGLEDFKTTLESVLPDSQNWESIDEREILLENSGSSCATPCMSSEKIYLEKPKQILNSFSKKRGRCKRCVIQAKPGAPRDSVILTLKDRNTVILIERELRAMLEANFESFIVDRDLSDFQIKYDRMKEKCEFFFCRDIEKEGLTKPIELQKAILEVLSNKFPENRIFSEFKGFYDFYEVELEDGSIFTPKRGHGLGMGNSLTTLMQIVIFLTSLEKTTLSDPIFFTHNDDNILGFRNQYEFEDYWEAELSVLQSLSVKMKLSKSFFSPDGGVFLEKYFSVRNSILNKKESYQIRELLIAYSAVNIVHAKAIVSSLVALDSDILEKYLKELIAFWGYEFFPDELDYPAFCGGWFNSHIYGISTDLIRLGELEYNSKVYSAFKACRHNLVRLSGRKQFKNKNSYTPPLTYVFPDHVDLIEKEYFEIFDMISEKNIIQKYNRIKERPESYKKAWEALRLKRQRTYFERHSLEFSKFIEEITSNSTKDFIPLEFMIEKISSEPVKSYDGKIKDIFSSNSPKLAYLSYIKKIDGVFPNPFAINFAKMDSVNKRLTADERKRLSRYVGLLSMSGYFSELETVLVPEEILKVYINPHRFAKVYSNLESPYLPIIREEYRSNLLKKKELVYPFWNEFTVLTASEFNLKPEEIDYFSKLQTMFGEDKLKNWIAEYREEISELEIKNRPEVYKEPEFFINLLGEKIYFEEGIPLEIDRMGIIREYLPNFVPLPEGELSEEEEEIPEEVFAKREQLETLMGEERADEEDIKAKYPIVKGSWQASNGRIEDGDYRVNLPFRPWIEYKYAGEYMELERIIYLKMFDDEMDAINDNDEPEESSSDLELFM